MNEQNDYFYYEDLTLFLTEALLEKRKKKVVVSLLLK
jgi:hypothetical protein